MIMYNIIVGLGRRVQYSTNRGDSGHAGEHVHPGGQGTGGREIVEYVRVSSTVCPGSSDPT